MAQRGLRTKAGDRTRAAILGAAIRLLGREGPEVFSAATLAKETGVSKATIFHHFHTIDEIPLLALEQFWAHSLTFKAGKTTEVRDYLQELGQQVTTLARKRTPFLRTHLVFLTKALFDARLHNQLAAGSIQMHQRMTRELSSRLPKSLPSSDVDTIARMAETFLDGMMVNLAIHGPKGHANARRVWAHFLDLLLLHAEKKR